MKIGGRGGHTPTSPGTSGYIDELKEDRIVYPKVLNLLKNLGHPVIDLTPPDSYAYPDELSYGISKANANSIDLGFSIHFNAGGGAGGSEVWIDDNASPGTIAIANRILSNLNNLGFINRGIKHAPSERHLGEITNTDMPFFIIEVCFTDVSNDKTIYDSIGTDTIAAAIAQGITGQTVQSDADFIKSVQHDLQRVSCLTTGESNATGILDANTQAAIKQFRYVVDLPSSENIDDSLVSALNSITQKPTIGAGWTANTIATKFIQWFIGISPKNGVFDTNTTQKVKDWQFKNKIWANPDGVIREVDWNKILK